MVFKKGHKVGMTGKHHSDETKIKMSKSRKGKKLSEDHKNKIRKASMGNTHGFVKGHKTWSKGKGALFLGEKNPHWKGDNISYTSLHGWINNNFGKPVKCENCGGDKNLDWSNKDHNYSRERKDWQVLCKKCHRGYDKKLWKKK